MRKAERLFQIVSLLRGRRQVLTAEFIAENLGVSVRTIYRDIQALSLSGVPIEGEAGVGYRLGNNYNIPPIMFSEQEMSAMILALKMVKGHSDDVLSVGANTALEKIFSVVPEKVRKVADILPYYVPKFADYRNETKWHTQLREAAMNNQKVSVHYEDGNGDTSTRVLWPLGLMYWGSSWTLLAHCELRNDYRNFRLDRFLELTPLEEKFEKADNLSVEHYLEINNCILDG
jgi:predicted DNA-binding transcriptional regulator YafY